MYICNILKILVCCYIFTFGRDIIVQHIRTQRIRCQIFEDTKKDFTNNNIFVNYQFRQYGIIYIYI